MNNQIPFNPISMANRRTALSVGLVTVLLLAALLPAIPIVHATASTASVSTGITDSTTGLPGVDAKTARDVEFTVTNPSSSTASYAQIQIVVSARWAILSESSVTTTGLGGTASVSISGTGPYVVVVSNIALAPSAAGKIKLLGAVADVGTTGSSYTDGFNIFTLDVTSGATLQASTSNPVNVRVSVASGTGTFINQGMEPKATFASPTLSSAESLRLILTAISGASSGSAVTVIIAGRDASGNSVVGKATLAASSAVAASATATLLDGSTSGSWKSIDAVYMNTAAGVTGDKYKIQSVTSSTDMVTGIEAQDSTSGSLKAGQSINVAAYVTDNTGKGVSGVAVTFSTSASTSDEVTGGSFTSSSVTTDALGAAKTIFTTSITQGTQTMKARSSGLIGSGSSTDYKITTVWGSATTLSLSASPDSIPAVGGSSTITAKLLDANGNTIKGTAQTITFGTSAGSLSASSATTSTSTGKATIVLSSSSTTTAGSKATITATAITSGGTALSNTATVSFTTGPVASVTISIDKTTIKILESATVTATVKDSNGNVITGASVSFSRATGATPATNLPTISPSSATTGADGKATATLTASIEAGTATVTASSGGFSGTTGTITINGGTATDFSGSAASSTITADGSSTTAITFTLQDAYDNTVVPSAAIAITLTTTGGTFSQTGTTTMTDSISATTGMTTSGGITLKSSTTVGKVTVTATGGGYTGSVDVTFGAAATTFKLSPKPSIVQISTATTITIQLLDPNANNALATNAAVSFTGIATEGTVGAISSISTGGTKTTFTWTAPSAVPAGGLSTIRITGTFTTAGASTFTSTVTLTVQVSGSPFKMSLSASPTTAAADGSTIVTISAKIVDASGVTIITSPGTTVQLASTAGTVLTTTIVTATDTGIATGYVRAPTTAGLATVTALGGGVSGSLTYNFTQAGAIYKATSTTPTLQDTAGNPVTAPTVGNLVSVASTITNTQSSAQQTLLIVQVKDSTGKIVYLTTASLNIPASTAVTLSAGWTPTAAGTYTIEAFAWDSFSTANVLAIVQKTTVTVS
ncbi:MAG: Ig-like domain-containing protein [Thaumarchaeota archaeon]|nr:Ig-like domain-containing protein [Nitrososphaerota archaeon]